MVAFVLTLGALTMGGCEEEDPVDGGVDASSVDAASVDAGAPDSSLADVGSFDSTSPALDAGAADTGAADTGPADAASELDAGGCPDCLEAQVCDEMLNVCVYDCGGIQCTPDEVCDLTGFYCTTDPMQCGDTDRCSADEICDGVGCVVECGGIQCFLGQVCSPDGLDCVDP